jgi:endonuclease-8
VPEGDTLYRIAAALKPHLVGRSVLSASARQPGPRTDAIVGATITSVESRGKHLLISFDSGLELRTHLGMHGSWHRYATGEKWRRPPSRARLVIEVPGTVAVCFDAPTVELYDSRAASIHPVLSALGPDLLDPDFGPQAVAEAVRRLRAPHRVELTIAEALLDQQALAGIGNIFKSETLFVEEQFPFERVAALDDESLRRLIETARRLLMANLDRGIRVTTEGVAGAARGRHWVYGRTAQPCRRCETPIVAREHGRGNRRTYWCPSCQPEPAEAQP